MLRGVPGANKLLSNPITRYHPRTLYSHPYEAGRRPSPPPTSDTRDPRAGLVLGVYTPVLRWGELGL